MGIISCRHCGAVVGHAADLNADIRATCSACLPDPMAMLRFSVAVHAARRASGYKLAYCAARAGVTACGWLKWERGIRKAPPYAMRDKLVSLFADTPAAPIILKEVLAWPSC